MVQHIKGILTLPQQALSLYASACMPWSSLPFSVWHQLGQYHYWQTLSQFCTFRGGDWTASVNYLFQCLSSLSESMNISELIMSGCVKQQPLLRDSQGSHQLRNSALYSAVIPQTMEVVSGATETQTCTKTESVLYCFVDKNVWYM